MSPIGTFETSTDVPAMAACGGNPDTSQRLPDNRDPRQPTTSGQRHQTELGRKICAINSTDLVPMSRGANASRFASRGAGGAADRLYRRPDPDDQLIPALGL